MTVMTTGSDEPVIDFGTSGLRGRAEGFTREAVFTYVVGFLETACARTRARTVLIGRDLRESSPAIAAMVAGAVEASGWQAVNAGAVPTPALALDALERGVPAIMVTGSHIPPDYNGLKFYRPDGELLKNDEAPIRAAAQRLGAAVPDFAPMLPEGDQATGRRYRARFIAAVAPDALAGLRIGIFEHSAVGRDIITAVLAALGAECVPVVGFEANGGFLVGSDIALAGGGLTRLPTRDALLPLIAVLAEMKARGVPVSQLAGQLPRRVMKADRLRNIAPEIGQAFVAELAASESFRGDFDARLTRPRAIDTTDGTRLVIEGDVVVHFRQSGNAPEFRCYVETDGLETTEIVLAAMMAKLAARLQQQDD